MTEYEIVDALSSLRAEIGGHVMNFAAVLFGYLVTAYFVGGKLSRFQVTAITAVYIIFLPGPLTGAYEAATTMKNIYYAHPDVTTYPLAASHYIVAIPILVPAIVLSSWVISVLFMIQTRKTRPNHQSGT